MGDKDKSEKKIAVLIGTRPGIIKMAPIVKELESRSVKHIVIHTGQHYSFEMDRAIMKDIEISHVDYHIKRPNDCVSHAQQTAYMLVNIEDILLREKPDLILVCGDANTNLAGALAARKLHVGIGHVEAGLRSFDWRMPEEHNRIIIDHISEYLFCPTNKSREYLVKDGVRGEIFVVGNTIVDSVFTYANENRWKRVLKRLSLPEKYVLLTMHREENVDQPDIFLSVLKALKQISEISGLVFVFPIHPRTRKKVHAFGLEDLLNSFANMRVINPLGYRDCLSLISKARLVMTDSGGIQEEACILKVPCITLRMSTERPETVAVGANIVAGTSTQNIVRCFDKVYNNFTRGAGWDNPYGDGRAAQRIVDACLTGHPRDEFTK